MEQTHCKTWLPLSVQNGYTTAQMDVSGGTQVLALRSNHHAHQRRHMTPLGFPDYGDRFRGGLHGNLVVLRQRAANDLGVQEVSVGQVEQVFAGQFVSAIE